MPCISKKQNREHEGRLDRFDQSENLWISCRSNAHQSMNSVMPIQRVTLLKYFALDFCSRICTIHEWYWNLDRESRDSAALPGHPSEEKPSSTRT